ncbi:hypothetical protein Dimus_031494 [Dionaea muscipula]
MIERKILAKVSMESDKLTMLHDDKDSALEEALSVKTTLETRLSKLNDGALATNTKKEYIEVNNEGGKKVKVPTFLVPANQKVNRQPIL